MHLFKPFLLSSFYFYFLYSSGWCMLKLTCSEASKCCIHNIWGCGWNGEKKLLCVCSSSPSLPQICSYFQTPKIFSLSLGREKHSPPLGSIILSHPAKAVALGGSAKNFISHHGYIWLLSGVRLLSSSLFVWLHNKKYTTLNTHFMWL